MLAAVAQICSTPYIKENLATCIKLMKVASSQGAKGIFFPEASDFIAENKDQAIQQCQNLNDEFLREISNEAARCNLMVSIGVHEKFQDKYFNSHVLIDNQGKIMLIYRKLHLFDVEIKNGPILKESEQTIPGREWISPINTIFGNIGLGICYDLRFPEFSMLLRKQGADILTYPSAFTVKTGMAHWQVLLQARAIETQSYVIAGAQIGAHTLKRNSYGHAMIIDPWGSVIAQCSDTHPSIAIADIDLAYIQKIRNEIPVLKHRRDDLYSLNINA